jgi:hypothetical protein
VVDDVNAARAAVPIAIVAEHLRFNTVHRSNGRKAPGRYEHDLINSTLLLRHTVKRMTFREDLPLGTIYVYGAAGSSAGLADTKWLFHRICIVIRPLVNGGQRSRSRGG